MFTLPPKAIWLMYIPSLYLFSYLLNVHSCDYAIRRKFLGLLTVFWLERLGFVKFYIVTHTHTETHQISLHLFVDFDVMWVLW